MPAPLMAAELVNRRATGPGAEDFALVVRPGAAEAGRTEAGPAPQAAVDQELAATWQQAMRHGLAAHGKEPTGPLAVRAGLAAQPYLSRRPIARRLYTCR